MSDEINVLNLDYSDPEVMIGSVEKVKVDIPKKKRTVINKRKSNVRIVADKSVSFGNEMSGDTLDKIAQRKRAGIIVPIYQHGDSIEDMTSATIDLIGNSQRTFFKIAEKDENDVLKDILKRKYAPSSNNQEEPESDKVRRLVNLV